MEKIDLEELGNFIGTERYHKGYCGVNWTDGVAYLATHGAGWLCTDICAYAPEHKEPFQLWELKVKDGKGVLTMREDCDQPELVRQEYDYTDFPEPGIKLYLVDGILLLPSEY